MALPGAVGAVAVLATVLGTSGDRETADSLTVESPDAVWVTEDNMWYTLKIGNATAGVLQTTTEHDATTGQFRSYERMNVTINRGQDTVRMMFITKMIETGEGQRLCAHKVLWAGTEQQMAEDTIKMSFLFDSDKVHIRSEQHGVVHDSTADPIPTSHIGRYAARRLFATKIKANATHFKYSTVKPELGASLINVTSTKTGDDKIETDAGVTEVTTWDTTIDGMPLKVSDWVDEFGDVIKMHIDSGTGLIEAMLSTKEGAHKAAREETSAPELVDSTNVILKEPNGQLHSWSRSTRATFLLRSRDGERLVELPSEGFQRVEVDAEAKTTTIRVDLTAPSEATSAALVNLEFIEPSAMIDSMDANVRAIVESAVGRIFAIPDGPRADKVILERAHKLRLAVKQHIKVFDLATGYASASETARRASGDCSEHAVLLAAVLRVDGIPSRVCSGLVYTERAADEGSLEGQNCAAGDPSCSAYRRTTMATFAWHAWTQALIGGRWIDLDATLYTEPYSVGHVLMGVSSLSDRTGHADEMKLVALVGNLEMDVLSVE